MGITTIQIDDETKALLASFKSSPRETYQEVIQKLAILVPAGDDEGPYHEAFRLGLLHAKIDVRVGRLTPHDDVKRRLGL